jgi:hypothetical protein
MPHNNASPLTVFTVAFILVALFGKAQPATGSNIQGINSPKVVLPDGIKRIVDVDNYTTYAVYNDEKSIHIIVLITDSLQKKKVLQNGMEVWVDAKGKKNKTTGILFPLSPSGDIYPGGGNRKAAGGPPPSFQNWDNKKSADTSFAVLIEKRQQFELKGFAADLNGKQNINTMRAGITVALRLAADTLIYEAVIPFGSVGIAATLDKSIAIGIVEKGTDLPGFEGMGGPGAGGDDGGGGPPGGFDGGPPPGPPPGEQQDGGGVDFRRLFSTNVIWFKFKLRNKPTI